MGRARALRLGFAGLLLGAIGLATRLMLAAPLVGAPLVVPTEVPAGKATDILVTSRVVSTPPDPPVLSSGVALLRVARDGRIISTLGRMRDDGREGDATAGDGTFTLKVRLTIAPGDALRLRVSASFDRISQRVLSTVTEVPVTAPDTQPPTLTIVSPANGSTTTEPRPRLEARFADQGSGIRFDSLAWQANSAALAVTCQPIDGGATCTPDSALPFGAIRLTASIRDVAGNQASAESTFTLQQAPPSTLTVSITAPADGAVVGASPVTVRGSVSDPLARVAVQGVLADVDGNSYALDEVPLEEGLNRIAAAARGRTGPQATASATVVLDTIPPVLDVLAPRDRAMVGAPEVMVLAKVFDATAVTCTVNGVAATVTNTTDGITGQRDVSGGPVTLAPGPNSITVACRDAAGHSTTQRLSVFHDATPLTVTSVTPTTDATGVEPSTVVRLQFSEPVAAASVGATTLFLREGPSLLPATTVVSPDGLSATVTPTAPLPTGREIGLSATRGITDVVGNPMAAPFASRFTVAGAPARPGAIVGEVYDDTRSLPLEGVTVQALDAAGGELGRTVSDARGRYSLTPGRVDVLVRVSRPGFTTVERAIATAAGTFAEVIDARLTVLAAGTSVPVGGGSATSAAGSTVVVAAGALGEAATVQVTDVSPQGPRRSFPLGWAPVATVDVRGLDSLAVPATLRPKINARVTPGRDIVVARLDESNGTWRLAMHQAWPGDGTLDAAVVTGAGQYAVLLADQGDGAPAIPAVGESLPEATDIALPVTAAGVGVVVPPVGRADDPTPARATVTLTHAAPMRSGTLLRGDFVEVILLRSGDRVAPPQTGQDLFAYRAPEDAAGTTLVAPFPIAPSRTFGLGEVTEGAITVDMSRGASRGRSLTAPSGGGVVSSDGARLTVPVGAFTDALPVSVSRLSEAMFPLSTPTGFGFVGAVDIDLFGAVAAQPLWLSLEGAVPDRTTGSTLVLAAVRTVEGVERLIPVALGRIEGDAISTFTDGPAAGLPGVSTGGRYVVYQVPGELVAISGTARDVNGRRDGHVAEVEALPFVFVTDGSGRFALLSAPGAFALQARGAGTLDVAKATGMTGAALPELLIAPTAPMLTSVTVRPPPVPGLIGGPVVLLGRPAPRVHDDAVGDTRGDGDGQIEAGERVGLTFTLRNNGTAPLRGGAFALRVRGTENPIDVAPLSIAARNLAPDAAVEVGPFVFEVPAGVIPGELGFSLYHLADGAAVSNEIAFALPLGVEHPAVSVGSEITLRFSEPVTEASLLAGVSIVRETSSGDQAVSVRVVPGADASTFIVRMAQELADSSRYRMTLGPSIIDRDGRALAGAPIVERFSTEDRTPPPPIDPGNVTASAPDGEGYVTVTGTAGSVNPDDTVLLLNDDSGMSSLATVTRDGGFTGRIVASLTERLLVLVRDRADNRTQIEVGPFIRRDPLTGEVESAVVRQRGGSLTRDGMRIDVPAGALPGGGEIGIARVTEPFALPTDEGITTQVAAAFAERFRPAVRVRITADVPRFASPLKVSVPVPRNARAGDLYLVVRQRSVTVGGVLADLDLITGLKASENPVRTVGRLELLDTATVKDDGGRLVLSTDSPPFDGILEPGILTFLEARGPVTFFAGQVRRDSVDGRPVEGAIVRSLPEATATFPFAAVTNADGAFVVADASAGGPFEQGAEVSTRLDVFDQEYSRVIRRDVRALVGPPAPAGVTVGHLSDAYVLPERLSRDLYDVLGDIDPPTVTVTVDGPGLRDGFARTGRLITVTVSAFDNDEVTFQGLQVDAGGGYAEVTLDEAASYQFTPTVETIVRLRARARDRSGNSTFRDLLLRTVNASSDDQVVVTSLVDRAPESIPPPLWNPPCTFDGECRPRFTEPLDPATITVDAVRMFGPDGRPIDVKVALDTRDGTLIRIAPKRNLRFDSTYTILISSSVRDLNGQAIPNEVRIFCKVPAPTQLSTIPLANAQDVGLKDDGTLVAINHPVAAINARTLEPGALHTFRLRDEEGNLLKQPQALASTEVTGRPLSLAVHGNRVYVGSRYLGDPGTAQAVFSPLAMLGMGLGGALGGGPLGMFPVIWTDLPTVPSNLQVFDLTEPAAPKSVGMRELNNLVPLDAESFRRSPMLWNPNTFPIKAQKTSNGIGIVNAYNNLEVLTDDDVPESLNIIERVDGPMVFPGRCEGGPQDGMACTISHLDPLGSLARLQCGGAICQRRDEVLNAAFIDQKAVALDATNLRVVDVSGQRSGNHLLPSDRTLGTLSMGGSMQGARVAALKAFEWEDASGQRVSSDLAFVSGPGRSLSIVDVTDAAQPYVRKTIAAPEGNLALDACSGVAYVFSSAGDLHAFDFNDPSNPTSLATAGGADGFGILGIGGRSGYASTAVRGGILYLAGTGGIAQVRVRNGTSFQQLTTPTFAWAAGGAFAVAMVGAASNLVGTAGSTAGDSEMASLNILAGKYPYRTTCVNAAVEVRSVDDFNNARRSFGIGEVVGLSMVAYDSLGRRISSRPDGAGGGGVPDQQRELFGGYKWTISGQRSSGWLCEYRPLKDLDRRVTDGDSSNLPAGICSADCAPPKTDGNALLCAGDKGGIVNVALLAPGEADRPETPLDALWMPLEVVEPKGIEAVYRGSESVWHAGQGPEDCAKGQSGDCYVRILQGVWAAHVLPAEVSFYNVQFREGSVNTGSGWEHVLPACDTCPGEGVKEWYTYATFNLSRRGSLAMIDWFGPFEGSVEKSSDGLKVVKYNGQPIDWTSWKVTTLTSGSSWPIPFCWRLNGASTRFEFLDQEESSRVERNRLLGSVSGFMSVAKRPRVGRGKIELRRTERDPENLISKALESAIANDLRYSRVGDVVPDGAPDACEVRKK